MASTDRGKPSLPPIKITAVSMATCIVMASAVETMLCTPTYRPVARYIPARMHKGIARGIVKGNSHANFVSIAGHNASNRRANANQRQKGSRTISRPSFKDCFLNRDSERMLFTLCSLGPGNEKPCPRTPMYATARARIVTAAKIEFPITTLELLGSTSFIFQVLRR